MRNRDDVQREVEADFRAMEDLAAANPGILDVIRVFGNYEAAVRQAEEYLSALSPRPIIYTTYRSS